MLALISDIHGNLEALEAVSAQVDGKDIVCLGDVVCYGPDSIECVKRSAGWKSTVAGPLDLALLHHDPNQWNPTVNRYVKTLVRQFRESQDAESLHRTLESYGTEFVEEGQLFFHGAPGNIRDWIFPEEVYCPTNLDKFVDHPAHVYIGGGSHIPGIFRRNKEAWEFTTPENEKPYDLSPNEKTIITIGSVGQPRDGDPRAAYAVLDDSSIIFHRVDYDFEITRQKINDDPDIDDMQGDRLPTGN